MQSIYGKVKTNLVDLCILHDSWKCAHPRMKILSSVPNISAISHIRRKNENE